MGEDNGLQILIEAALDFEKSLNTMTTQMNQMRDRFKDYTIKITAGLNQTASAAQIKSDLKSINQGKNRVRLTGEMDREETKKNVTKTIKGLKQAEIKIAGVLDASATTKNIQQQFKQIPDVSAKAEVNVDGAEQVDKLASNMDKAGKSAANMAGQIYVARTALAALRRAAQEAAQTVVELDKAATDLALVTGDSSGDAYTLLNEYNEMAQQLGATTTQISDAATEWLRQGKTAAETTALIEQSMVLSKVGAMESAEATKNLTSAMKGYGLTVEDVSGIVDKLTAIDLKAAVTASDLAVAMSRTANSANISGVSMDRLLGYLATVEEVTQKSAETIGESFKTIFARMGNIKLGNYMDDDGEDLSDVETVLKNFGIALRDSEGDFRDFSIVLDEVYAKWEQFSGVDKRAVANAFAGTRQQENFLVLMENYGKALEYAGVAADSAGTAMEKFTAYEDSIGAKAATFTAAMESLTMDTVDPEFVKDLIEAGTAVVEFAEKAGLLKAVLISLGAGATMKGVKLLADGFNTAKQSILNLGTAINTLRDMQDVSNMTEDTIKSLGQMTKGLSDEQMKLVLTSNQLSTAQMQAILMASGLSAEEAAQKLETMGLAASQQTATGTTMSLSSAMTGLGASIKAAFATNPIGMTMLGISAVVTVVSLLASAWESVKQKAEEARQSMNEAAEAANEQRNSLSNLVAEYQELATAGDFDSSARETAKRIQEDITKLVGQQADNLDLVNGKLDEQIEKLHDIRYQDAKDAAGTLETKYLDAQQQYNAGINARDSGTNFLGVVEHAAQYDEIIKKLGNFGEEWKNVNDVFSTSYALSNKTAEEVLAMYKELQAKMLDSDDWQATADDPWTGWIGISSQDLLNDVQDKIELYQGIVDEYNTASRNYLENQAIIDVFDDLKTTTIDSQAAFDAYINNIQSGSEFSEQYKKILIEAANDAFPQYTQAVDAATDGTAIYVAQLSELSDTLSNLRAAYSALESAQVDMADGGGLSTETIEALADAEENYLDYLYEENGLIKLNTDAWEANANAKVKSEMGEIEKEISSLQARNAELQESITYYQEQRNLGNDGGLWSSLISETTEELESNNIAIAENQKLLAVYSALYGDITGDMDAYTAALHNFTNVANSIDSISSSFQTLADLQATVAEGFTMSLEKALEFAAVYPEILNNAQVTADGQIALNEGVVNTFIQGKKAELDTQIDAQIAQLEADKAVLEAKMQAAQAQLDLAKSVGEGEGQISKELAEYRINAGNAVAQALIDAGIDEATAFKLAAAAMSQNAQEFNQIAADVCTDVNGNFNQAAYDLAQTMYNNLTNVKTDLASVAKQAHQTAQAIAGIADGSVAGSSTVQGGSGGGTTGNGIKINLTSGNFEGTEYTYEAKEIGLDDFIADLELDISTYEDAIAQIDGQIATLQALKNIPLKEFKSDSGSDSGSGSDEVEEYIADIDKYREAVERLRKTQELVSDIELKIEDSDNIKEKILLTRQLIGAYEREQDALHDLNNERDATIQAGVESLRELGFAVEYNADTNDLWISNMEHLNELTADSVGSYGSMQEATNALREDTEGLIDTITELNEENREGSESWKEVESGIKSLREQITDYLSEIVQEASDSVDSIQSVYDTLHEAADEYASSGYIAIDTLQKINDLGQQYLAYLMDENGQLVINEERIQAIIAARTQQMAIESSLAYVEALRMAKAEGDIATLNNLLYATEQATNATWGFVYANLALAGLDDAQYQAALQNINALRSLAESAVQSIGQTVGGVTEELEEMQNGLNDILDYVMDMLKQRIQDQIDGLEDMKDAYSEIIELKKESLEASKDEADYQKTMASKMREIAKLQARIDALSLDDSREAQAEKAALLEEMSELQQELADDQADRTLEAQEDALDKMEEAYHEEKDKEIEILEDSISSYQKLYDMAIEYIESHWDTLYSELISWNTQYGDVLNSEITSAWDNCLAAAQRYGSYVSALNSIGGDIEASQSSGTNIQVGNTNYDNSSSNEDMVHAIIKEMYANSRLHHSEDEAGKAYLNKRNLVLGAQLAQYGITAVRGDDGVWYVDRVGGELLYDKYKKYIYHKGGIVGGGDLKSNEQISLLKTKEWVLSEQMVDNLTTQMDRINLLSEALSDLPDYAGNSTFADVMKQVAGSKTVNNVTNNSKPIELQIGDTTIYGADQSTVKEHIKITRDMVNQIGRIIGIGR